MPGDTFLVPAAAQGSARAGEASTASIQPHGLMIVVRRSQTANGGRAPLRVVQISQNASRWLQRPLDGLLACTLDELGGDLDRQLCELLSTGALPLRRAQALQVTLQCGAGLRRFEARVQRVEPDAMAIELDAIPGLPQTPDGRDRHDLPQSERLVMLQAAVQRFSEAPSEGTLADMVVRSFRQLTGYDRCIVQVLEPGHARVIAEARGPGMPSLLGMRLRHVAPDADAGHGSVTQRVQMLADVRQRPVALVPQSLPQPTSSRMPDPGPVAAVEVSAWPTLLGCPPAAQMQALQRLGVVAMLSVAIVRDGRIWAQVVCHHTRPRRVGHALLKVAELMAEVIATRLSALSLQASRQLTSQVRLLEARLLEATADAGDWSQALVRHPEALLDPMAASGAVLHRQHHTLRLGRVPEAPELTLLLRWLESRSVDGRAVIHCDSLRTEAPSLAALAPMACGVLAVRLSPTRPDWLLWLRPEQPQTVTWAGEPDAPLSSQASTPRWPRRVPGQLVERIDGCAASWSSNERTLAAALAQLVVDITTQVEAVRLLIAEHQLSQLRSSFAASDHAVVVVDAARGWQCGNAAFLRLRDVADVTPVSPCSAMQATNQVTLGGAGALTELLQQFRDGNSVQALIDQSGQQRHATCCDAVLIRPGAADLPVAVRAEPVPALHGGLLGWVLSFEDLRPAQASEDAMAHLEAALACLTGHASDSACGGDACSGGDARRILPAPQSTAEPGPEPVGEQAIEQAVLQAIVGNARKAASELAGEASLPGTAARLRELEASATRAVATFGQMLDSKPR